MTTLGTPAILTIQKIYAADGNYQGGSKSVLVGENEYVAWFSNKSGNRKVLFRTFTDGGQTFCDKINLSNITETDSVGVELLADGDNVLVTCWEWELTNATSDEPVGKMSTDGGKKFNDMIRLFANGTIGRAEGKG